jgi:hypothetical protein
VISYDDLFSLKIILMIIFFDNIEFSLKRFSYTMFGLRRKIIIFIRFADIFIIPTISLGNLILNIILRIRAAINSIFFSANIFVVIILVDAVIS